MGRELSISTIARMYGISLRSLRFYEAEGLIAPRREGLSRFYSARDRIRIELILKGKRLGFSLAEIRRLLSLDPHLEPAKLLTGLGADALAARLSAMEARREELLQSIDELQQLLLLTGSG